MRLPAPGAALGVSGGDVPPGHERPGPSAAPSLTGGRSHGVGLCAFEALPLECSALGCAGRWE